jgi:very-short-patch-repair endonuclease
MNPKLKVIASGQGGVFSRQQAAAAGYTPEQMRERLADGRWERVRHGQYAEAQDLSQLAPWDQRRVRHRSAIHAVVNSIRPGSAAVSHQSALVLHDLTLWGVDLDEVHLTRLDERRGRAASGVRHHRNKLLPIDLTEVEGLAVTTLPRALVELACTNSFESVVVAADCAFRGRMVSKEEALRLLAVIEFWPGSPTARAALAFGNRLSESVGESRLRVLMHDHGLPAPVLQFEFSDAAGFVARVDFYFPDYLTVVEFDGLMKYGGGSPEVLIREKIREDRLRALGVEVVRITWADLSRPAATIAQIRNAFARSRRTA